MGHAAGRAEAAALAEQDTSERRRLGSHAARIRCRHDGTAGPRIVGNGRGVVRSHIGPARARHRAIAGPLEPRGGVAGRTAGGLRAASASRRYPGARPPPSATLDHCAGPRAGTRIAADRTDRAAVSRTVRRNGARSWRRRSVWRRTAALCLRSGTRTGRHARRAAIAWRRVRFGRVHSCDGGLIEVSGLPVPDRHACAGSNPGRSTMIRSRSHRLSRSFQPDGDAGRYRVAATRCAGPIPKASRAWSPWAKRFWAAPWTRPGNRSMVARPFAAPHAGRWAGGAKARWNVHRWRNRSIAGYARSMR